jgi:hypothetical protein
MGMSPNILTVSFCGIVEQAPPMSGLSHVIRLGGRLEGFALETIPLPAGWCGFHAGDAVYGSVDIYLRTGATEIAALHFDR